MDNEQRILWKNVFITFYGDWIGRPLKIIARNLGIITA